MIAIRKLYNSTSVFSVVNFQNAEERIRVLVAKVNHCVQETDKLLFLDEERESGQGVRF